MQNKKAEFHCPRWSELPSIPLYLDQLVMVVQNAIGIFFEDEPAVTKTMINNYVKQGLLAAPEQKKYNRSHIARIIVISLLKRVFSMTEIQFFIERMAGAYGETKAYDMFCEHFELILPHAFNVPSEDFVIPVSKLTTNEEYIFSAIIMALVCKLKVQDFLNTKFNPPANEEEE